MIPTTLSLAIDVGAFALVALLVVIVSRRAEVSASVRRRLLGEAKTAPKKRKPSTTLVRSKDLRNPALAWVQKTTLQDPKERTKIRRDLIAAGFDSPSAPAIYVIIRFCLAAGLPIAYVFSARFSAKPPTGLGLILFPLGLAVLGLVLPRAVIDNRAGARRTQIENEFPDALDLMVVCVESGLGLEGAVLRVGAETEKSHPLISTQFQLVSAEMRAGRTRAEALRHMADRVNVGMVSSFVALMIQTDALGGSVAQSLRTYSAEMRAHRMLRAEEKAMRLPVLLTIPLVLFILPVICAAVLLPAVIDVMRTITPAMKGN
jgi:tight adherence protein C